MMNRMNQCPCPRCHKRWSMLWCRKCWGPMGPGCFAEASERTVQKGLRRLNRRIDRVLREGK